LIALYAVARTDAAVNGRADLARVASVASVVEAATATASDGQLAAPAVYSPTPPTDLPRDLVGALEIPSVGLRAALYADTSEVHLNRGVGLIAGMAAPGEVGNLGVAAHRDGTFRPLEHIEVGAKVELHADNRRYVYRVTSITVVDRTDAALLRRTDESVITLVTCYPFRFVGRAPRRFVVRASLDSTTAAVAPVTQRQRW
jgi:LPXTG-site transpeptidase (sortase) family protein